MSLQASRHLWNARVDPKRRHHAVGIYTHVLDQWGIIYDQPLVLTQRQAGAAIEGAVRQSVVPHLELLAVDTHGYTDFAMAICKLLGFDLCPRLRNIKQRQLPVPKGMAVPDILKKVVRADLCLDEVEGLWDELARVAASIQSGQTSGTLALARFGSAARGDPVYRAGSILGRICRTLFLCDYFANESFRRELLRILNHGESVHALQRAIHFGGIGVSRGRRQTEMVAISGSLTLLTNIVMAWVTHRLQSVLDRWHTAGHRLSEEEVSALKHTAPVHFEGINLRGTLDFPIDKCASRLLGHHARLRVV